MAVFAASKVLELKEALKGREEKLLEEIGVKWKEIVKQIITEKGIVDTGKLRDSMDFEIEAEEKSVLVGTATDYAVYNELGTVKMEARPFLTPSVVNYSEVYTELAEKILNDE